MGEGKDHGLQPGTGANEVPVDRSVCGDELGVKGRDTVWVWDPGCPG